MPQPIARPLPPTALRVLAATADAWGLGMCAPLPAIRTRAAPRHGPADRARPVDAAQAVAGLERTDAGELVARALPR